MAPETLPVLRCESRRRRPEPRWGVIAAVVVLMASTLDALWLVPAQRAAEDTDALGVRYRCFDVPPRQAPTPAPTPSPTAHVRVDGILLMSSPR
jgi:hypothetical protein